MSKQKHSYEREKFNFHNQIRVNEIKKKRIKFLQLRSTGGFGVCEKQKRRKKIVGM